MLTRADNLMFENGRQEETLKGKVTLVWEWNLVAEVLVAPGKVGAPPGLGKMRDTS